MARQSKSSSRSKSSQSRSERENGKRSPGEAETPRPQGMGGNQGEGNREADRHYREGATQFERSGRVPRAAEEARREIEVEDEIGAGRRDDGNEQDLDFDTDGEPDFHPGSRDRSRLS
jgi:hypothetical protein